MEPARGTQQELRRTPVAGLPPERPSSTGATTRATGPLGSALRLALVAALGWLLLAHGTSVVRAFGTGTDGIAPPPGVRVAVLVPDVLRP